MDINSQKFIYFNSPLGTYSRINYNLFLMGLDKGKKFANTYLRTFCHDVLNNTYMKKYKYYDVIYLDEFYIYEMHLRTSESHYETEVEQIMIINALIDLANNGKQIVMASHANFFKDFSMLPEFFKDQVNVYDLNYDTDWTYDYKIEYINSHRKLLNDYWKKVIKILDNHSSPEIDIWFKPLEPLSMDNDTIYFKARSDFHKKRVDFYHLEQLVIKRILKYVTNKEYDFRFIL